MVRKVDKDTPGDDGRKDTPGDDGRPRMLGVIATKSVTLSPTTAAAGAPVATISVVDTLSPTTAAAGAPVPAEI